MSCTKRYIACEIYKITRTPTAADVTPQRRDIDRDIPESGEDKPGHPIQSNRRQGLLSARQLASLHFLALRTGDGLPARPRSASSRKASSAH